MRSLLFKFLHPFCISGLSVSIQLFTQVGGNLANENLGFKDFYFFFQFC